MVEETDAGVDVVAPTAIEPELRRTIVQNLGQMGTRMDAIIHMGKKAGTFNINNPESQAFMALTKAFASHVAPGLTTVELVVPPSIWVETVALAVPAAAALSWAPWCRTASHRGYGGR